MNQPSERLRHGVATVLQCFPEAVLLHLSADDGAYLASDRLGFRVWPDGLTAARLPDGSLVRFDVGAPDRPPQRRRARARK